MEESVFRRLCLILQDIDTIKKSHDLSIDDFNIRSFNIFHREFPQMYSIIFPGFKVAFEQALSSLLPFYDGFPIIQR